MNSDELTKQSEAEDEKFRIMIKNLTRTILLLILVILLIIGGAVYYFVNEYGKGINSNTEITITKTSSDKTEEETK